MRFRHLNRRINGALWLVILGVLCANAYWAVELLRGVNQKNIQKTMTASLCKSIETQITLIQSAGISLTHEPHVRNLIQDENNSDARKDTLVAFEAVKSTIHAEFVYLLDKNGIVVASTYDKVHDIVGVDYSFRPYYKIPMSGQSIVYPAFGVKTDALGIFFGTPIVTNGQTVGVVVIKTNSDYIQSSVAHSEGTTIITSDDGIVFCSNVPELLLCATRQLDNESMRRIRIERQFPDPASLKLLPLDQTMTKIELNKQPYVVESTMIEGTRWRLYHLLDHHLYATLETSQTVLVIAGFLLIALLSGVIIDLFQNIQKRKTIEHELQEYQNHLEDLVRMQTRELRTINAQLRQDIQERKRAEEQLLSSEAMLADAQRLARLGNWVWENGVYQGSDELFRILKYEKTNGIPAGGWDELVTPEYRETVAQAFQDALSGKAPYDLEYDIQCADGEVRHVLSRGWVERTELGEPTRMVATILDITEQKQAEEGMIRAERMAAVGTLAGGVAHEFNNINAIILGYAELAKSDSDSRMHRYIDPILKASQRAKNITQNLLSFSGRHAARRKLYSLSDIARETLDLVENEFSSEGVRIISTLPMVPKTMMDNSQISQVVLNLLVNAKHALIDQPERIIEVESGFTGSRVWLRVRDSGCGIRSENLTKIFTPFYSTKGEHADNHSPQAAVRGTGLGLSVSHTIISQHEGKLTVESQVGDGSCFTITLPIRTEDTFASAKPIEKNALVNESTILILDDEVDIRNVVSMVLVRMNCRPVLTDDGTEALRRIAKGGIDMVLVDLQMPKMSGTTFLQELKKLAIEPKPIALVFTGRNSSDMLPDTVTDVVYDVLAKPFNIDEISDKITRALAARAMGNLKMLADKIKTNNVNSNQIR